MSESLSFLQKKIGWRERAMPQPPTKDTACPNEFSMNFCCLKNDQ